MRLLLLFFYFLWRVWVSVNKAYCSVYVWVCVWPLVNWIADKAALISSIFCCYLFLYVFFYYFLLSLLINALCLFISWNGHTDFVYHRTVASRRNIYLWKVICLWLICFIFVIFCHTFITDLYFSSHTLATSLLFLTTFFWQSVAIFYKKKFLWPILNLDSGYCLFDSLRM